MTSHSPEQRLVTEAALNDDDHSPTGQWDFFQAPTLQGAPLSTGGGGGGTSTPAPSVVLADTDGNPYFDPSALPGTPSFAEAVQDAVAAMVVAGTGVTATYSDTAGTLTLTAAGGGGGTSGFTVTDNNDGTASLTATGTSTVTDNNDGTAAVAP